MEDQEYSSKHNTHLIFGPFTLVGLAFINGAQAVMFYLYIMGEILITFGLLLVGRVKLSWSDVAYRVKIYGVARAGFTLLFSFFVGLAVTTLIGFEFVRLGLTSLVIQIVSWALVHNIVPLLISGLLLINLAKHFHADVMSLKSYALKEPNLHCQIAKIAFPEITACVITLSIAYFYAIFAALGGQVLTGSNILNEPFSQYGIAIQNVLSIKDIVMGFGKVVFIGFFLGILKAYYLFYTMTKSKYESRYVINMVVMGFIGISLITMLLELFYIGMDY